MSIWYYTKKNRKHGPIEKEELLELFKDGKLSIDTLVWRKGLDEWAKAILVEELKLDEFNPPALPGKKLEKTTKTYVSSGPQVRPWVRSFARGLDMGIYALITTIIIALFFDDVDTVYILLEKLGVWSAVPLSLVYMVIEFFILSATGTTLGKFLFKIRIKKSDENNLSYYEYFRRSIDVWIRGLGCYIPFVSMMTYINFGRILKSDGITPWDKTGGILVQHQILGRNRIIAMTVTFVVMSGSFMFLLT